MTNGKGADVAIEAVGSPKTLDTAIESVKQGGNISIIGVFPLQKVELSMRQILLQGLQIKAGRANLIHMGRLLSLIRGGKLDVTPLISHRMPLTDAVKAYDLFSSRTDNVMKIILNP
jgi:alcohol dehydrogenase